MFSVNSGQYSIDCLHAGLPSLYDHYKEHARLAEEFGLENRDGDICFLSVANQNDWPFLVVAQDYSSAGGFHPGALLIPETDILFIGAGERLLCYDLRSVSRVWEANIMCGFWDWARFGDVVIMSAEVDMVAWNARGEKLWTAYVEPPWEYQVLDSVVQLDVMGSKSQFSLTSGPKAIEIFSP